MNSKSHPDRLTRHILWSSSVSGRQWIRMSLFVQRVIWQMVRGMGAFTKRVFDMLIAVVALFFAAPLFLLVTVLVKMDGGPVFFRQKRVGLNGQEFEMWKFRSMCVDAEQRLEALLSENEKQGGVTFKLKNDPRITVVGRIIRRTSIDELPQFFNVIQGDMSIVGPRPPVPREVALYSNKDRRRLMAKPGLTCLWQVGEREGRLFEVGDRNCIDFDEQVRLDVHYIEQNSLLKDIWIMLKTPPAMLLGK